MTGICDNVTGNSTVKAMLTFISTALIFITSLLPLVSIVYHSLDGSKARKLVEEKKFIVILQNHFY